MRRAIALACLTALAIGADSARAGDFQPLVSGTDASQFTLIGIGPGSLSVNEGEVRLNGKPDGYFATKRSYKNFVLRFDWMYERPAGLKSDATFTGNSGLLLHIKEHKIWPESIEVQLMNADAGNTFGIPPARFRGKTDSAAQKKAIKPVGQWNAEEVVCKDGAIAVTINGVEIARGVGAVPDHGTIGWQSEGAPIRFRNLQIKEGE